ncbi:TrkH family potassium uptake protein [Syntrophomonas erecta]
MIRPTVILNYVGKIVVIIGVAMLTCVIWSIYYEEEIIWRLLLAASITIIIGYLLGKIFRHDQNLNYREGFAVVTLGWVAASFFGTLPFLFSGYVPSFADALFETVSGFTTTGASILTDVEALPHSLLFWRCLTQWLGGMGIMALFVAIIVGMGVRANQIFRAEVPGPVSSKLSPRVRETARVLWKTYVFISVVLLLLLWGFGMDLFDAFCHTFATISTGGFSTKNQSVGYFQSPLIQWTIILFMFIGGVNFSLHYLVGKQRSFKQYIQNREFVLYTLVVVLAVAISAFGVTHIAGLEPKVRAAAFQVVSIITTTGFASADFDQWAPVGKGILFLMMFLGGCAGSTSGGIKIGRYLIMLQRAKIELKQMIHPKAMVSLRFGDRILDDSLVINVLQFFFLYLMLVLLGTLAMNMMGLDIVSGTTAVLACLGNIGPGFGLVGPTQNFSFIPDVGKYLLSLLMLLGRLEIYPILVMLVPEYWKE